MYFILFAFYKPSVDTYFGFRTNMPKIKNKDHLDAKDWHFLQEQNQEISVPIYCFHSLYFLDEKVKLITLV